MYRHKSDEKNPLMLAVVCSFGGVGEISSIGINFQKERSGGLER